MTTGRPERPERPGDEERPVPQTGGADAVPGTPSTSGKGVHGAEERRRTPRGTKGAVPAPDHESRGSPAVMIGWVIAIIALLGVLAFVFGWV
ncbi:MAG: hypothetical protein ACRENI_06640 [Gemmatimonadaceae bacterium]